MNQARCIILGLAFLAFAAPSSFAQSGIPNGPYLRIEGGWSHPANMDGNAPGQLVGSADRHEGFIAGGAAGYTFGPWRAELDLDYSQNGMKSGSNALADGGTADLRGNSSNFSFMVNGYYDIATGTRWTPYIGFGIGGTDFSFDDVSTTSKTPNAAISNSSNVVFAYQPIVGLQYRIDPNWSVNAEYRYFASSDATLNYESGGKLAVGNASHNFLVGLTYRFAAPSPPPPPPQPMPTAAPVPRAAPAPAAMAPAQTFLVFFEFDKASLTPQGRQVVEAAAAAYREHGAATVSVAGYTDRAGPAAYNMRLSRRRADTVRGALVGDGVPADVIQVSAYGEEHPRVPTPDGVREAQNRRVEIKLP